MAERKDVEKAASDAAANAGGAATPKAGKADILKALPAVESPPLCPVEPMPVPTADAFIIDPVEDAPPLVPTFEIPAPEALMSEPKSKSAAAPEVVPPVAVKPVETAPAAGPRFTFNARQKRYTLLAASVALAAAFGAVFGALASGGLTRSARTDVAGLEERWAMQQSIAHLAKEITTLKASVDLSNKSAHAHVAKLNERLKHESADVTGSISAPETTAPAAAAQVATPMPRPRPVHAAADALPPARLPVLHGWSIRDVHDGLVYVEGHGDIFQVAPGAPLPGLGPVQSIRRERGRWVVATPKGLIVSMREDPYFDPY